MSKEEKYKAVALELIHQWVSDSITIMYEYSGNFDKTKEAIKKDLKKWLKKIDSEDLYESIIKEHELIVSENDYEYYE